MTKPGFKADIYIQVNHMGWVQQAVGIVKAREALDDALKEDPERGEKFCLHFGLGLIAKYEGLVLDWLKEHKMKGGIQVVPKIHPVTKYIEGFHIEVSFYDQRDMELFESHWP